MPTLRITDLSPAQFARRVPRALGVASSSLFRISLCVLLLFQNLALATAQTVPTGGRVVGGQAAISAPSPGQLSITQTSNRAIIDWNSFSVGPGASVTFQQPGAGAAMLNRVTGATTSEIAGAIKGNGQVFLINPNGIAITPSGTVDTGAFLGSSLDMANEDFMAGRLKFRGSGESGSVSNAGRITTGTGGYAALLGADVNNSGTISSPLGRVALGSG
ncbi:MAG: filamentous hemagglutinin N-terminal domain-containing protein, partial [Beijerinckiaceae bacterium]|nr:filamentous hemagglutinin N-terminal domain-containing protein [Beijerinckiaceae bacterium]